MRLLAVAALVVIAAGGCQSDDERDFTGTIASTAPRASSENMVGFDVELTGATFAGSTHVAVSVRTDELFCRDGAVVGPNDVEVGDAVTFIGLVGGDVPSMDPPPLRGRDFRIDC